MADLNLRRRWGLPVSNKELSDEVRDELQFHLEMRMESLIRRGLSEVDARAEAARRFGGFEDVASECDALQRTRERKRMWNERIGDLVRDVRLSGRSLRRHPVFTFTAVLTLALGIGVTTAIFSVFDAVLVRGLSYGEPERLVNVWSSDSYMQSLAVLDALGQLEVFDEMAATAEQAYTVTGGERPVRVEGAQTTPNLFQVLGVAPVAGRALIEDDGLAGAPDVAVISQRLARRRYGSAQLAIGEPIRLEGGSYEVVGVMPDSMRYPVAETEVWTNLVTDSGAVGLGSWWGSSYLKLVARLAPGATAEQAVEQVRLRARTLREENPIWTPSETYGDDATVDPIQSTMAGSLSNVLRLLLGAAFVVLLVACANVANLLLARSSARQQEAAIRTSLGAGRLRLVLSMLVESLLIAAMGATLGLGLAMGLQRMLLRYLPGLDERFGTVGVDLRVLLFSVGLTVLTALLFGLAPALRQSAADATSGIGGATRGLVGTVRNQTRLLAIAQLGLAVVLLFLSGLLLRSLWQLLNTELGFQTESAIVARVDPADSEYRDSDKRAELYRRVLQRLEEQTAVESAAAMSMLPMSFGGFTAFNVPSLDFDPNALPFAMRRDVTPGTLRTLGIPLLAGRDLSPEDEAKPCVKEDPCAVVVNRVLERTLFGDDGRRDNRNIFDTPADGDASVPVGRSIGELVGESWLGWFRVVGVAADARLLSPEQPGGMTLFLAHAQNPSGPMTAMHLIVRGGAAPEELERLVREAVDAVDPQVPVDGVQTLEGVVRDTMAEKRLLLTLIGGFAGLTLLLCCVGIYGVISYFVDERQSELGVRAALGATPTEIRVGVLRQAASMTLAGLVLGGVGSWFAARAVERFLFETAALRLEVMLAVPVILGLAALASAWLPAVRAARLNPVDVLRS